MYPPADTKPHLHLFCVKPWGIFTRVGEKKTNNTTTKQLSLDTDANVFILFNSFSLPNSPSRTQQFGFHHLHQLK